MQRASAFRARRAARRRSVWRRAAGRGNGPGRALPDRQLRREASSRRRSRCADARDGAAADLSRARHERRARHGAGAAAAAQRSARGARSRAAVRRHAAAAESELRSAGEPGTGAPGEGCADRRAMGAQAAHALPARAARLDQGRARRSEPRNAVARRRETRTGRDDAAGIPAVVGRRRGARSAARRRPGRQRLDQAPAGPGRSRHEAPVRAGRGALRRFAAARAAEQPALLRRARPDLRSARRRGARLVPSDRTAAGRRSASSRRAKACRRRRSS